MVSITHKSSTLRKAIATAIVTVSSEHTMEAIRNRKVPKGDVFEFARAAGLLAIKKTSDLIPDCHPLPIEFAQITYHTEALSIVIRVEVHTIYKTGVEVEAMHGASLVALTLYDMLKPIDKGVEISHIRLEEKKGGKTDLETEQGVDLKTAVIICSDSIAAGKNLDLTGQLIREKLLQYGISVQTQQVIADEFSTIQQMVKELAEQAYQLVLFAGGTGLSPRDVTPDAIQPLLDKEIPGIMETARNYGQQRMPYAMLSRGVAGFVGNMLVLTLPGSPSGATESIDALFPSVLHVFNVKKGFRHGA
ncbi:bifunctional molybdenum cofactor biosynthesis protein MoaC/MoaB [Flavihumibacter sp. CACIAM 22H1]|uniref:bifunctional molybdenum cofactor biosynthesis protein MoaC/MoaB n=1 Tax=Flavihumibacter sp. CACIAM 22H1 TaxID=1812911 RepID=UPI0007A8B7DA|nr:bifunctional molybdenum cofactor biosynthesis protein MoaC/MoaB [Flavihumibacter sp. CACIAM 22H1]KYP14709.1 MAG: molybdenum cofactor biosynthesis protein MoaC [Flavihumibacter sp. CACIAM 22H1]